MKNVKFLSAATGAALAVVACLSFYDPVPVYADFGELGDSVDYITGATGEDAEALIESPVAGWILLLYAFQQFYNDTQYDIVSTNGIALKEMSGTYINEQGVEKFATLCLFGQWTNPGSVDAMLPIVYAEDFGLYVTVPGRSYCASAYNANANPTRCYISCSSNCELYSNSQSYLAGSQTPDGVGMEARPFFTSLDCYLYGTGLTSRFKKFLTNSNTYPTLKNESAVAYELPPSDDLSFANLDAYIQGDFRNYVVQYYPEYIYLLPEPEPQPTETLDPSETMPGLPVIELPTVPAPDYDLELPEKMLEGAGFWFTALTSVLEKLGWLSLVIVLAVIAIVLYYVF